MASKSMSEQFSETDGNMNRFDSWNRLDTTSLGTPSSYLGSSSNEVKINSFALIPRCEA